MPITKYEKGDIRETPYKYVAQGVNCQNVMGSGVARALSEKWPKVKSDYHEFNKDFKPEELLGAVCPVEVEPDKTVFNCYTQLDYGYNKGKRFVNYAAVAQCFTYINHILEIYSDKTIAIPKIGAGLACGDWNIIEQIINDATPDIEVVVYEI